MNDGEIDLREKCAVCGHSFSFHGRNLVTECRAMGCKGDNGHRCQFFERPAQPATPVEA